MLFSPYDSLLGIDVYEFTESICKGKLEINQTHYQPAGSVNGGVYCSIVETVGSIGATAWLHRRTSQGLLQNPEFDFATYGYCVGVNNSTDFYRPAGTGTLWASGKAVFQGKSQQVWIVDITNDEHKLCAQGKLRVQNIYPTS